MFFNKVYVSMFCVALILGYYFFFTISLCLTWKKLKDKLELQFSFIAITLGWNLYFIDAFISGSPRLWPTGSVCYIWESLDLLWYSVREKLVQNRCSVFIVFYNVRMLSSCYQLNLIIKAYPHPKISYYHTSFSHWDLKKNHFYFFAKV